MPQTADIIIIGAGIVGTSIALSLSREGLRTLNIDALPAAGYGSTSNSSAIVRPFYTHVEAAALAHEARHRWIAWADFLKSTEPPIARYTECGMAALLYRPGDFAAQQHAMREAGIRFDPWTLDQLREHVPSIAEEGFGPPRRIEDPEFGTPNGSALLGALFIPEAGYVNNPQGAAQDLMAAAVREGARFLFNESVTEIRSNGRIEGVRLGSGETISAPLLVNAAGPHSAKVHALAREAGPIIATRALRHEVAYLPRPPSVRDLPVTMDSDCGIYLKPDGASLVVGTLDPACDPPDVVDPDAFPDAFTDQWTNQAWRAGLRLPDLLIPGQASGVVALYDVSEDWIPIYDRTDLEGYFLAIGTSGNQFKNAPMIGDLMARIILATGDGHDHDTDPLTLHLKEVARTIDLRHYSRLRAVKETSNVLA